MSFPIGIGYDPVNLNAGASNTSLNAANNRVALSFVPLRSKTINTLQLFTSSVTGTLAAADCRVDIFADSAGNPTGSSLAGGTPASAPTSNSFISITGLSLAVTAGTRYHVVVRNNNATPASNFFNIRYPGSGSNNWQMPHAGTYGGGSALWGWGARNSTDGGTTWVAGQNAPAPGVRIGYSDGTFEGYAALTHISDTPNEVRGTQEAGVRFTIPAGYPTLNCIGVSFIIGVVGTAPAGDARARLYTGSSSTPTLTTTTPVGIPTANITTTFWYTFTFATPQALVAGTTYRVMLGVVSGGSAGNALTLSETRNDLSASTVTTHPLGMINTVTTDGINFTDNNDLVAARILLDVATPFTVSGGIITHPGMQGGFQG